MGLAKCGWVQWGCVKKTRKRRFPQDGEWEKDSQSGRRKEKRREEKKRKEKKREEKKRKKEKRGKKEKKVNERHTIITKLDK